MVSAAVFFFGGDAGFFADAGFLAVGRREGRGVGAAAEGRGVGAAAGALNFGALGRPVRPSLRNARSSAGACAGN